MFNNATEAAAKWRQHQAMLEARGVYMPEVQTYVLPEWKSNYALAMDAMPTTFTANNSAVPMHLTTMIDPDVVRILFTPNKAVEIFGEQKKGSWLDETMMFQVVEHTGEVSSYGDYANSGQAGVNTNWPQRQSYLYQVIKEYGEREMERASLSKISWSAEIDKAAVVTMDKFQNYCYFFGVQGLANYGLLNDPSLSASITPATKAAGGATWITSGVITATANEIFNDIESLFIQLLNQTAGLVDRETKMTLAMSPQTEAALLATNSFGINVSDLLKKNFPNITVKTAVQYGVKSSTNPQGVAAGNLIQLIADSVEGQDVGYLAYNERMRTHPIVKDLSSYKQKVTAGTWGAIIRFPLGIASMVGV
jgi:hypothetical protein